MNKELIWIYLKMYLDYCLVPVLLIMHLIISTYKGTLTGIKHGWFNFLVDYRGAARLHTKKLKDYKEIK